MIKITMSKSRSSELRSLVGESWSMGWPMMLIMFFQFAIGITDVYVAGRIGTQVLAAVGYVGQLYFTLMILANGLSVGTVSMVAQAYGAGSTAGIGSIASNSLMVGIVISGLLTGITQVYYSEVVSLAGMPAEIRETAEAFIRIFSLVLVPTYVMIITGGVLRASGRVRVAMVNACAASVVNLILDLVLSFGCGPVPALGYKGIAWATAAATTLGMALNVLHMIIGPDAAGLKSLFSPITRCIWNLIRLGVPSALQQIAWNAGTLVVYFLVSRLQDGEITALAAMTAGLRIEALIFLPIFAFNMASAVLTGNRLGAGDVGGARSAAMATAGLSLATTLIPSAGIFVLAGEISGMITDDPAVLAEMVRYLRINMLGMPFLAVGVALSGALQGAGDTLATMRIIFTGMWLVRIPLILATIHWLQAGAVGVWWSLTASLIVMCGLLGLRFRGQAWVSASLDKARKTMMWQACVPQGPQIVRPLADRDPSDDGTPSM